MKKFGAPKFNEAQKEIVNHKDGACLVLAGAGSGKTFSLIQRVKNLINKYDVPTSEITIITFTKNSANDLIEKLKDEGIIGIRVGTFHSVCSKILSSMNLLSFNPSNQIRDYEVDNIWTQLNNGEKTNCMDIRSFISYQKAFNVRCHEDFKDKETEYDTEFLRKCYMEYESYKERRRALDFDDILLKTYDLFKEHEHSGKMEEFKTKYLLIDEAQDNSLVQNLLLPHLCSTDNIMAIGDARQTLYSFRGSSPQEFLNFKKVYPNARIIDMNINYRSCSNIIDRVNIFARNWYKGELFSDTVAGIKEKGRIVRKTIATDQLEAQYVVDNIQQMIADGVKEEDIAIIYRLNENSSMVEMLLKERGIPYTIDNDASFFKIKEISTILCVLRLMQSEQDNMAYEEVFNSRMGGFKFLPNTLMTSIRETSYKLNCSYLEASVSVSTPKPYQKQKLIEFSKMIEGLKRQSLSRVPLNVVIETIIRGLNIEGYIADNQKYDTEKKNSRLSCLRALGVFTRNSNIESFLSLAYSSSSDKKKNEKKSVGVNLMTVHKSKGLEWENVFFIGHGEKFPNKRAPIEEEANIFYVGATRAKTNLWVTEVGGGSLFINQFCEVL